MGKSELKHERAGHGRERVDEQWRELALSRKE
jgi:hypothetical protein